MRIYRMTATFGKLEHQTLTLEPGFNLIQANNEWGKSTWCAFLCAMLYGLDTRAKSTKTVLADKERYAPWSGSPMAGSMDIHWNGRDITIQRRTKGRIPLGDFRAFETETGLAVPELTAQNCGQQLLGVEQSVFRRAGFIRLTDMPVTQDQNLSRRLSALVTTGDESGDGELLARKLKELKNKIRSNRTTGLLPQAEGERQALEATLRELEELSRQSQKLKARLGEVGSWLRQLNNHKDALEYEAARSGAERVAQAREAWEQAEQTLMEAETACAKLPSREETCRKLQEIQAFRENWNAARMEAALLPEAPQLPAAPAPFVGMDREHAQARLRADTTRYARLREERQVLTFLLAALCLAGGLALLAMGQELMGALALAGAIALAWRGLERQKALRQEAAALETLYGSSDPKDWQTLLEGWLAEKKAYELSLVDHRVSRGDLDVRLTALETQRASLCGAQTPEVVQQIWQRMADRWAHYEAACWEARRAEQQYRDLQALAKPVSPPEFRDELTDTPADTARMIGDALAEQQRLQHRLGQYQGRMEVLGDPEALEARLLACQGRIRELEKTYAALTLALDTLAQAQKELQRRFAPRITKRAQELLERLTLGRYRRLRWGEDLMLHAGAGEEDTLREALWRSDGTVDQLYLSLRLAVAEVLTPEAPLVLDDALVRFDDARLEAALTLLEAMAEEKQVIVFTCQSRETKTLNQS